jgi:hypothetical protein
MRILNAPGRVAAAVAWLFVTVPGCGPGNSPFFPPEGGEELANLQSIGLIGVTCPEDSVEREFRVRFTATSTGARPIEPGTDLGGFLVDLGQTFSAANLAVVENAGLLFPTPDVACAANADCDAAGLNVGAVADGGSSRFECVRIDGQESSEGGESVPSVCARAVTLSVDVGERLAYLPAEPMDDDARRNVVVLYSNSYQMNNFNPFSGGTEFIQGLTPDLATNRRPAIQLFYGEITNGEGRFRSSVRSELGVFSSTPSYSVGNGDDGYELFDVLDSSNEPFAARLLELESFTFNAVSTRGHINHFTALRDAILKLAQEDEDIERSIVLLTDGDVSQALRDGASPENESYEAVRDLALAQRVPIHVVHLDVGTLGRTPIGGLADLAQLACLTGGSFRYLQEGTDIQDTFRALGEGVVAGYEAVVRVDGAGSVPSGVYTLGFQLQVTLNGVTETLTFNGNSVRGNQRVDTRASINLSRPCATADDCLLTTVCDEATATCRPASDFPFCADGGTLSAAGCAGGAGE